jgi:uncharacterized protein involved in exopolysaccharide biosynthesis
MTDESARTEKKKRKLSILDFFLVLAKRKVLIIGSTIIAVVLLQVMFALSSRLPPEHDWSYFPNTFKPQMRVMITWQGMAEVQEAMGLSLRNLSSVAAVPGVGNPYFLLLQQLMLGNTVLDRVSEELDLYSIVSPSKAATRGWLILRTEMFLVTPVPIPTFSVVQIGFSHTDKELALAILNKMVEVVQEKFNALASENIKARKNFILERMVETEYEIEKYKNELVSFQEKHGIVDLDRQTSGQSNLLAEKTVDILKKELELRVLEQYMRSDSPRVRALRNEIETTKKFISDLKSRRDSGFIPIEELPDIKQEYTRIEQDLKIQIAIYEKLKEEYEKIKLSEINTLDNLQIIEKAEIPEGPFFPIHWEILFSVVVSTLIVSTLWACVKEYYERLKRRPGETEKYEEFRNLFRWRKK